MVDLILSIRADAEACFGQTIDVAHRRGVTSFELRVADGLVRQLRAEDSQFLP